MPNNSLNPDSATIGFSQSLNLNRNFSRSTNPDSMFRNSFSGVRSNHESLNDEV